MELQGLSAEEGSVKPPLFESLKTHWGHYSHYKLAIN